MFKSLVQSSITSNLRQAVEQIRLSDRILIDDVAYNHACCSLTVRKLTPPNSESIFSIEFILEYSEYR